MRREFLVIATVPCQRCVVGREVKLFGNLLPVCRIRRDKVRA